VPMLSLRNSFGRARRGRAALVVLLALAAGPLACASEGRYVWVQELPPIPPTRGALIQVGDTLIVKVFAQDQMSSTTKVAPDGTVTLPLVGAVSVVNQRPGDVAVGLEARLKPFINSPSVSVQIQEAPVTVSVMGEVHAPSVVSLDDPPTLSQALARAGGLTQFADESRIFVLRPTERGDVQRIRFTFDALAHGEPHAIRFQMRAGDVVVAE
jgi:polysaccharide export outer membrane protein